MKKVIILMTIAVILISMVGGAVQPGANKPSLKEVREKHEIKLFAIEGVSGVSADEVTNEIIVYIEKPDVSNKVPKVLDGFPVRFEVTGRIEALRTTVAIQAPKTPQTTIYSRTGKQRPVFGGISVGNPYITAGTLGIVTDDNFVLSNAHVLALDGAANFLLLGTPIWQPGRYDGGTSTDEIGVLYKYIPIVFNNDAANNYADAAIATLTVSGMQGNILNKNNNGFYTINGVTTVSIGDKVRKSGRTTGVTTSTVRDTQATVKVNYGSGKTAVFRDQIIVRTFSQGGDSGSAVDKNGQFVGLLFAGSPVVTIVNKQQYILEPLGITI